MCLSVETEREERERDCVSVLFIPRLVRFCALDSASRCLFLPLCLSVSVSESKMLSVIWGNWVSGEMNPRTLNSLSSYSSSNSLSVSVSLCLSVCASFSITLFTDLCLLLDASFEVRGRDIVRSFSSFSALTGVSLEKREADESTVSVSVSVSAALSGIVCPLVEFCAVVCVQFPSAIAAQCVKLGGKRSFKTTSNTNIRMKMIENKQQSLKEKYLRVNDGSPRCSAGPLQRVEERQSLNEIGCTSVCCTVALRSLPRGSAA